MDTQTVFQVGNSLAITIPRDYIRKLGWKKGKKVFARLDPSNDTLQISEKPVAKDGLTPEYVAWKKEFFTKNSKLLSKLAKFHGA